MSDNDLTIIVNTLTNLLVLKPALNLFNKGYYTGGLLLLACFVASCLVHLTETKHQLKPFWGAQYTQLFLNLDRLIASLTTIYILGLSLPLMREVEASVTLGLITRFVVGMTAAGVGELTPNLGWYTALHTVWHYCSFSSVSSVVDLL